MEGDRGKGEYPVRLGNAVARNRRYCNSASSSSDANSISRFRKRIVTMRHPALGAVMCMALALTAPAVFAQAAYPVKTVRIIVPYAPGGANDVIARIIADDLTRRLGQTVLVENRPGASTAIGAEFVAKAPPDGYTLLGSSLTTFALLPNIRPKLPYDALRDFEPVSLLALQPFALAVHPSVPATSVKQLIAVAKAN